MMGEPEGLPTGIEVTISAQTRAQIKQGEVELLDYRLELTGEAQPLHVALPAIAIDSTEEISIISSSDSNVVQVLGARRQVVSPPASGQPRTGVFELRAVSPGYARIAVMFRQGGSELGTITLAVEVVEANTSPELAGGTAIVLNRLADDDLTLTIQVEADWNGAVRYDYKLNCEKLGLTWVSARSQELPGDNEQLARQPFEYINNLDKRVTLPARSAAAAAEFVHQLKGIGIELGQLAFPSRGDEISLAAAGPPPSD